MELTIIVPIFNEEGNIKPLYDRLCRAMADFRGDWELLFINDGSNDGGFSMLKSLAAKDERVRYIDFSRNFGHQIAVTAGLEHAEGEAIAIIDADLQDPPELIPDLYKKMQEGFEVVYARRKNRLGENWFKKMTAKVFYRLLKSITSIDIPLDTGDFRIIDRKVAEVLLQMPEYHKFIRGQISWIGFRQTSIEYERQERHAGNTGYTFRKMLRLALDGITSFSDFPLKLATALGFVVSGISFLILLYALYVRLIGGDFERGWTSLIVCVLFIGGVQLISIGIIGEYIGRINTQVKNRPLYIVRETNLEEH